MTLLDVAAAWRDQDPDDETRAELDGLIADAGAGDDDAVAQLHDRFDTRLEFGTAGLRGRIEAGSNRMNRVLVAQAAAGLAAFLLAREEHPSIVIGYDGRKNSKVFATDTAELMAGVGVRAILLPRELPTPVLAFAVRHLGVSAGVMVTASHNPPQDNGYKVYLGGDDDGSQIVPPSDGEIAAEILRVAATANVLELPRSPIYDTAGEEVLDEYVRRTAALASGTPVLRYVYTAMHGVGWETAHRVFREAGFAEPIVVRQQIGPDAAFPTVSFPNPEEPGAMDLAFALGTAENADLVIANDPDADRLAIGVPSATGWERLSGNEVGALLGWRAAERLAATDGPGAGVLAASIVSSPALSAVAQHYGLTYADTLTGFKWVSRVPDLSFGYEEALGYLVDPAKIRDKDGISAAVDFLALATELRAAGSSLHEHRLAFADTFGGFASGQVSIRVSDLGQIHQIMQRLRADLPETIGETAVSRVDDFADGFEQFPAGDILRFWLADGSRVIVRPSGTEPKVKVYLDASSTEGTADARLASAQAKVVALEAAMRALLA